MVFKQNLLSIEYVINIKVPHFIFNLIQSIFSLSSRILSDAFLFYAFNKPSFRIFWHMPCICTCKLTCSHFLCRATYSCKLQGCCRGIVKLWTEKLWTYWQSMVINWTTRCKTSLLYKTCTGAVQCFGAETGSQTLVWYRLSTYNN